MANTIMAIFRTWRFAMVAIAFLLASQNVRSAIECDCPGKILILVDSSTSADGEDPTNKSNRDVIIRSIEPDGGKRAAGKVTWLGVSVDEVPDSLTDQLGLKPGEGMVVTYVSADSPAAHAEVRKHDVLVALDDQMLVDPAQLRKLVQMHKEGDSVKLTLFRGGKKHLITAKLANKSWEESSVDADALQADSQNLQINLRGLDGARDGLSNQMKALADSLARAGVDKEKLKIELRQTMDQTRKAIEDAVKNSQNVKIEAKKMLDSMHKDLSELAGSGLSVGKDTTVVIKNDGKPKRTLVETDESGSYVIVADPKLHLTAHDQDGKLLFDGDIETPGEQRKVPKAVWEKIKPLIAEMDEGKINVKHPAEKDEGPEKP